MIGAIRVKINEHYSVKIYPVGTFDVIDWKSYEVSKLGDDCYAYSYIDENAPEKSDIIIDQGFDGDYMLRLVETKRYVLRIETDEHIGDGVLNESLFYRFPNNGERFIQFQNEGNKFFNLSWDRDSVTFQFVNYLGRSRITFANEHDPLVFEVIPDKFNYKDDYVNLTEALANECSALLLDYAGPTSNVYRQSETDSKTLLEQFIFLRTFCYGDNLQGLFEMIKRNPDRVLATEEEIKPLGTGVPSSKFYYNPFSYSRGWTKAFDDDTGHETYLPQMVAVTRKYDRLDTPANRFIKYALQRFDSVCDDLTKRLSSDGKGRQAECLKEAAAIHSFLEEILRDSFFDDIGDLVVMPQNNQLLQKREGYSQVFSAYSMLDLALQLDWQGKDQVYEGESKNVALLYEYWLFFKLYDILNSIEGCVPDPSVKGTFLDYSNGVTVSLKEGKESYQPFIFSKFGVKINLYYNRTFSYEPFAATKYEGSYSRTFRPDYTLAVFPSTCEGEFNGEDDAIAIGAVSYIHFDAKYRITDITKLFGKVTDSSDEELTEDKQGSVINTYKRGDLLKMHTYNNAIRRTVGSYVLYPGTNNDCSKKTFHIYDEILPGVGAFAIKPSISDQGERVIRDFIFNAIEVWSNANKFPTFNRYRRYSELIINAPELSIDEDNGGLLSSDSSNM